MKNYMTLCDRCAERMGVTAAHPEGKYFLTPVEGSRAVRRCGWCSTTIWCTQYDAESKATRAWRREMDRRAKGEGKEAERDRRAHYREPWRES